jgi:hypothetical protein
MAYRVRSPEGELRFAHFAEIANAYRQGLVDPEDVILEEGKEKGIMAKEHPVLRGSAPGAPKVALQHPLRIGLACVLGLGALLAWNHGGWPLTLRATIVLVDAVVLALLLMPLVQQSSRARR